MNILSEDYPDRLSQSPSRSHKPSWKSFILPEIQVRFKRLQEARQQLFECQQTITHNEEQMREASLTDRDKMDILQHENSNLKEELDYLRQTLLSLLDKDRKENRK